MVYFREIRSHLLSSFCYDMINDTEFALLYDLHRSKNPDIPHWNYDRFDLDKLEEDVCKTEFRFFRNDIYDLVETFDMPAQVHCYNNVNIDAVEALCVLLKRFCYPCRYTDMIPLFGRPAPQLSIITNSVSRFLFQRWGRLLEDFNQPWLSPANLEIFANAIYDKGSALSNCWGFIDGTVRPVCRPGANQRVLYNGHKKVHSIKFQSVVTPNGLIATLFGPVEGKRHDSGMLAMSQLLGRLQQYSVNQNGGIMCIYGDPAYPLRPQLQAPFKGVAITPQQIAWNKSMSQSRVAVEWIFGDIIEYFKFLDFKKNLKVKLSAVGLMYIVAGILHNTRAILYGTTTSKYFALEPPTLQEYFI